MNVFKKDGLEIQFMSRDEIRYSKNDKTHMISREIVIGNDGAPEGSFLYIKSLNLSSAEEKEMINDLTEAAVFFDTKFQYG